METKSLVQTAVAVLVAVLIFVTVLIPITNTATAETLEYHNTGAYFAEPDGIEHHIHIEPATQIMIVDGYNIPYPDMTYGSSTIAFGFVEDSAWIYRLESNGRSVIAGPDYAWEVAGPGYTEVTITSDGNLIVMAGENQISATNIHMYMSNKGNWIMSMNPYITMETQVYIPIWARADVTGSANVLEVAEGTLDDLNVTLCRYFDPHLTPSTQYLGSSEFVYNSTLTTTNLFRVDSINQHITSTAGSEADITITLFIVPESIEYDNPTYTSTNATLIGIIPILVIVGLILSVIGFAIARRYDL